MTPKRITRREFLAIGGGAAVLAVVGSAPRVPRALAGLTQNHVIYRLSLRGRRGSRAAKLHNANLRFTTAAVADLNRAHPGDRSRIVELTVSEATFQRLFPLPGSAVADLRKVRLGCIGDCDRNGQVSEPELVAMVDNALGNSEVPVCSKGDLNRDATITIDEILNAVNNAQQSCS